MKMTEPPPNNLPPYTSTDLTNSENDAPPPYQAILPNLPPPSFNSQPPSFPNPPPPFGFLIPPPSYSHANSFQPHLDNRVSGLVLVDGLHPTENEEEQERENSSTVLLYTLAVLTCMVCGFFAGLLFIILILLGEKRSTMPMGKRRKYFLFVSLVVSVLSFFFAFVVISWFGYFFKSPPFGGCRYGISSNKTCCPATLPASMCVHGVMRRDVNGCRSCCSSEACQNEWRSEHCTLCKEYSSKTDFQGCSECCKGMDCGDRGSYRNAFNCTSCCAVFDAAACIGKGMRIVTKGAGSGGGDGAAGCRVCCGQCPHGASASLSDSTGCPLCCPPTTCQDTYTDNDGCKRCCEVEPMLKCQNSSVAIGNAMCEQCCAGGAANKCAPKKR